jgi:hypothetical protein
MLPQFVPLAALPSKPESTPLEPALPTHHSEKEWAAVYLHIERMYVRERRKLRYVMQKMEEEYRFRAT